MWDKAAFAAATVGNGNGGGKSPKIDPIENGLNPDGIMSAIGGFESGLL
jgi:hypothetical protein